MRVFAAAIATLLLAAPSCSRDTESASCIEIELDRSATPAQASSFHRRVERIEEVAEIHPLTREDNIRRFRRQLRTAGYTAAKAQAFEARAHRFAGRMLIVRVRSAREMGSAVRSLQELPAHVSSVIGGLPCGR
jgi:cell division protein FtsX